MDKKLETGITYTLEKIVSPEESASQIGSGTVDVYSTPSMIAFMEKVAMEAVIAYLPKGSVTVGTHVNIRHLKPTLIGCWIKCTAILTALEGKKLTFSVEAWDSNGVIGTGIHVRFIVDEAKFISKLKS